MRLMVTFIPQVLVEMFTSNCWNRSLCISIHRLARLLNFNDTLVPDENGRMFLSSKLRLNVRFGPQGQSILWYKGFRN
ncbi:Uncharacterized protein APZ42_025919 [Daphnia magna]|uniref:Uncharacterized protein n=1 Tax=Daphnia magna TaxID=35525 RepID=A0A164SMV3_9CRUS|nr:Uncharacterized protein APZ42_025919 [Daphnia magna]